MTKPLHPFPFSVVLPVYGKDQPEAFAQALESLAQQTLRADEIVVVADGPLTAALDAILEAFSSRNLGLKVVRLAHNQGLSAALNAGIEAATHPWLARMDADDICLPHRFEAQVRYLLQHPEISLLGAWIREFKTDPEHPEGERRIPETHEEVRRYAVWRCPFNHMTVMYEKKAVQALGAYKNYGAVGDDYELWARFIMKGYRVANVQEVLVLARLGDGFFTQRRRGMAYLKNEFREIDDLRKLGLINRPVSWIHKGIKAAVRLAPPVLVKGAYSLLRKG